MTLNFSQSSAGRFEQLKTRVLEATLAGTLLLTDDRDRTSRFFVPGVEFGYFPNVQELPQVITKYLSEPDEMIAIAAAGSKKAHELAPEGFWRAIDVGLKRRGLRSLGVDGIEIG
jgi:spore maturation protein CgeB